MAKQSTEECEQEKALAREKLLDAIDLLKQTRKLKIDAMKELATLRGDPMYVLMFVGLFYGFLWHIYLSIYLSGLLFVVRLFSLVPQPLVSLSFFSIFARRC